VLPVLLWFSFHGTGISDGTPTSAFVAHWATSLPHLALLLGSLIVICIAARRARQGVG
jgi:hypothetical protein